jgi:RNA polymerase sigma factor (TIGR02999 family)
VVDQAFLDTLQRVTRGEAAESLLPFLYKELRRLAHALHAARPPGATLQTTDLVHEAYLKLVGDHDPGWNGRAHFFGAAARAMREILVDQARRKGRAKHGAGWKRVEVGEIALPVELPAQDILVVHEALERLEGEDPRKGQIVNLRFFAGLTTEETAKVLDVSASTVEREWRFVRAWLYSRMTSGAAESGRAHDA